MTNERRFEPISVSQREGWPAGGDDGQTKRIHAAARTGDTRFRPLKSTLEVHDYLLKADILSK